MPRQCYLGGGGGSDYSVSIRNSIGMTLYPKGTAEILTGPPLTFELHTFAFSDKRYYYQIMYTHIHTKTIPFLNITVTQ